MKSYEKTCFEFPQKVCDDEIAFIFRKLQPWTLNHRRLSTCRWVPSSTVHAVI
jgi:hypothetical protein